MNPVNDQCNSYCSGNVYFHFDGEKFIISFNQVAHWWTNFEDNYYDFQFILYPNGDIDLNYNSLVGTTNSATIGIQDSEGENGIQVAYNNNYLDENFSLRFRKKPDWISVNPSSGQIEGGSSETILVQVDAAGLEDDFYEAYLSIGQGWQGLPISMLVSSTSILSGDINGDSQVNIQDIIFLINFILGLDIPNDNQSSAADMNGDSILNIQDVILLVNSILGF